MDNTLVKYDLSIIIPCHNLEDWISKMLDSLNSQDLHNYKIELIFVCDNCTDNTKSVIERFLPFDCDYAAIHIFTVSFSSAGQSRNVGLDNAHGDYIIFFDGDDWIVGNNSLAITLQSMLKYPDYSLGKFKWDYSEWFPFEERNQSQNNAMLWQYIFRRDIIGETRFKNIQPNEDVEFMKEIIQKLSDRHYVNINHTVYYYNYGRLGSNMQQYFSTGRIE